MSIPNSLNGTEAKVTTKKLIIVGTLVLLVSFLLSACAPQAEIEASVTSGQAPLTVSFTNTSTNADEFQWDFGDGNTTTTRTIEDPVTHEYTRAGTHTVTLTAVKKGEPPKTSTMTLTVTVKPGPLYAVKLNPETVELDIGQSQEFSAEAVDAYDNPIPEAQLVWEIEESVGNIVDGGILTAGTKAGTFDDAIVVTAKLDTYSATGTASVTVNPDPLDAVTTPLIKVAAGETQQLEPIATDQYGNRINEMEVTWTATDENVGSVTQTGLLTANKVGGTFSDVVQVKVTQGDLALTATGVVTITSGSLERVVIAPDLAEIGMAMTQQFVAVGADQYGNRIPGLAYKWSVENGGGTIDANGLFTAGTTPDTYNDTVKVEATQSGITRSATADVTIEPDRIVFISDQNDDQNDIYIMDIDGTNFERLTTTSASEYMCSWSPDGRRIVYDSWLFSDGILVMNDDGSRTFLLIENESPIVYIYPAWSPDGSKIAFIKMTIDEEVFEDMDIFVMDVDGGSITQLTDTSDGTEWVPAWSPDGVRIVYDFTPAGQRGDIYVMNAGGSNRRRLTSHMANDTDPVWSPDGTQIAFISERDGDYEIYVMDADGSNIRKLTSNSGVYDSDPAWSPDGSKILFSSDRDMPEKGEIYVMDADGSNVIRLTNNSSDDQNPCWAPRKRGVEVTEASLIIPDASTLKAMTTQEVTEHGRKAVVRIETDLGTGSGFIIDSNGLIMTCNHVISDAEEITVYLEDGTSYTSTVEARDLVRDLALVRIEATELPYLELGDLSQVGLGQQVLVLGYPLGGDNVAVTGGLISAMEFDSGRNITWVQTDSAINPGNSGGPMLNLQGQVIGVVSAKMVGIAVEGMGFAISANTVNIYLPRLVAGETITAFN